MFHIKENQISLLHSSLLHQELKADLSQKPIIPN